MRLYDTPVKRVAAFGRCRLGEDLGGTESDTLHKDRMVRTGNVRTAYDADHRVGYAMYLTAGCRDAVLLRRSSYGD